MAQGKKRRGRAARTSGKKSFFENAGTRRAFSKSLHIEPLEDRRMLSINMGAATDAWELPADATATYACALPFDEMWAGPDGYLGEPDFAEFNTREPWPDFDPNEDGFQLTYSYSNLLEGLPGGVTPEDLMAATEEALGLWASVAPLHFIEIVDSGPIPSDQSYDAGGQPLLRIGHHFIDGGSNVLAHAYFPSENGLGGDVHFDSGDIWTIGLGAGFDILEVMTHELGHSLGLGHEFVLDAIMNPFYGERFGGLGTGFLLQDDIDGIQELYGEGVGSVTPLQPLIVDILIDENDGNTSEGDISLREAIAASLASGGKQKVAFAEELAGGTIVLDPMLSSLVIDGKITIEGLGSSQITIQAPDPTPGLHNGDGFSIFVIADDDPEVTLKVQISGLTLTGADSDTAGGAITSTENLTLTDVNVHHNYSAAEGGAIYSEGQLTIAASTIEKNTAAGDGGGVHTAGGITLDNSTFYDNVSSGKGGGISVVGQGTAIVITSSTISGNTSMGNGGALHVYDQNPTKLRVLHSTVVDNGSDSGSGGGIYMYNGVLVLDHSIIAGNHSTTAPDIDNINFYALPVVLSKYSLIGNSTGSVINELEPSMIGDAIDPLDPLLGELSNNGGPTRTHLPLEGSPVIDGGNVAIPFPPEFDQRGLGFDRIFSDAIDIGAVESTGFFALYDLVDTLADENDGDFSEGDFSLREALALANSEPGAALIKFSPSLSGGVITLSPALGQLLISDFMSIDASDLTAGLTISAEASDATPALNNGDGTRVLRIDDSNAATQIDVIIEGIAFQGGDVTGDGGGIYSLENLSLKFVSILESSATGHGGGLYHKDGLLVIENSTFAHNAAGADGGGLWSNTSLDDPESEDPSPTGTITNSTFSVNTAGDEGGGVFNFDGLLTIEHTTITENLALKGGGVVSFGDPATKTSVYSSIIAGNAGLDVERSRSTALNTFDSLGYNIVGFGNAITKFTTGNHDLKEVLDPLLGPLTLNGGKTLTHLPLAGSPTIDAGDPALVAPVGNTEYDQRGEPFLRFGDGNGDGSAIIDIGAVEVPSPEPSADFDEDDDVDGRDFLAWQRGVGKTSGVVHADGDADGDGLVDGEDLATWQENYGSTPPAEVTATAVIPTLSVNVLQVMDLPERIVDPVHSFETEGSVLFSVVSLTSPGRSKPFNRLASPGSKLVHIDSATADLSRDETLADEREVQNPSERRVLARATRPGRPNGRTSLQSLDEAFERLDPYSHRLRFFDS